jgi:MFS family permease
MDVLRSFKYRNFKLFFYGQTVSLLGNWIQKTAVIWLVYRLTGSAMLLGITAFVNLIPSLVLSPFAGAFIERSDRFRVIKNIQIVGTVQSGLLALLACLNLYNIPVIIFLVLVQGVSDAFEVTCRQSLMVEMIDDRADLPNAIALNSILTNLTRVLGPAIAGILLGLAGEKACFLSNFFSYIPVHIFLRMMRLASSDNQPVRQNAWDGLREGFHYVVADRDMKALLCLLTASSLLLIPFTTLVPVFAKDVFHGSSGTFGWFESALGAGAVLCAVYMAKFRRQEWLIRLTVIASLVFCTGLFLLSIAHTLPLALTSMVICGAGMVAQTSSINVYLQTHASPAMRSRVISYFVMAYLGVIPIGSLLIGALAGYLEVRHVVALEAVMGLVAVGIYIMAPFLGEAFSSTT